MTKFLLIRHATTDSVGKHLSGRMAGIHLNDQGRMQANRLAERLGGLTIKAVYSSPLERAVETAGPVAAKLHLENVINEDFFEIDFGEWTNKPFKEIENQPQFQRFNSFRSGTRIPGGELMLEAQVRIIKGLEKLCIQHPREIVVIVSHADLIRAAIAYYAGINLDMLQRIEISPASVSIIEIYEETARILLVNDVNGLIVL